MKRIITLVLLSTILSSALWAEGVPETAPPLGERTVIDCFDREVRLPDRIERVACLYAFTAHVTTMLGEDEKIVAVVNGSKRDYLLNEMAPSIAAASTPSDSGIINIEELLASDPDVVFLKGETALLEEETSKLDLFNIPWVAIDFIDIESQLRAIEVIGETLGQKEKARSYNDYYSTVIDETRRRLSNLKESDKIRLYHSVNEATRTDAAGTLMAEWTEIAGTINVSTGSDLRIYENKYFASIEQILLWDPDVILVNEYAVDRYILSNEKWSTLKAVQNGKVWKIPTGISRWGHPGGMETPLAILWTVKKLYPSFSGDIDMRTVTRSFYADFFDYQIDDELLDRILSGERMRMPKGS